MGERRRMPSTLVFNPGKILFGGGEIPCTVRNLSELGACLMVQSTFGLPAAFQLVMQNQAPQTCKVVWRDYTVLGVHFVVSARIASRSVAGQQ
jgi:hypothetical protein